MRQTKDKVMDKPSWSYWSVSAMGLLWGLMGCMNYLAQTSAGVLANLPAELQDQIASRPFWATAALAVTAFAGAVGCILLLLRRKVAEQVLALSLFGAVLGVIYVIAARGLNPSALLRAGVPLVVAAIMLWLARSAHLRLWLR